MKVEAILLHLEMDVAGLTCEGQSGRWMAFELNEDARSRTLLEALGRARLATLTTLPEALRARETSLLTRR